LNIQDNGSNRIMRVFVVSSYKRKMFQCVWVWVFLSVSMFGLPSVLVEADYGFEGCCWKVALRCIWNGIRSRNEIWLLSSCWVWWEMPPF